MNLRAKRLEFFSTSGEVQVIAGVGGGVVLVVIRGVGVNIGVGFVVGEKVTLGIMVVGVNVGYSVG